MILIQRMFCGKLLIQEKQKTVADKKYSFREISSGGYGKVPVAEPVEESTGNIYTKCSAESNRKQRKRVTEKQKKCKTYDGKRNFKICDKEIHTQLCSQYNGKAVKKNFSQLFFHDISPIRHRCQPMQFHYSREITGQR